MDMDASSAASEPGWRCQMSGCRCEAKAWNACPASCSSVITSSTSPTAFMKMNGRPRKWSVSQYPPGAFPFRLSRSRSRSSIMVWNWPPSAGSTRSNTRAGGVDELVHRLERAERRGAAGIDRQVPRPECVEPEPLAPAIEDAGDGRRSGALDGLVEALAIGRGVVEPELGRERRSRGSWRSPRSAPPADGARASGRTGPRGRRAPRCTAAWPARKARSRTARSGALEERLQLRQRALHPLPFDGHRARDALIARAQLLQLGEQRDVGFAEDLDGGAEPGERRRQLGRAVAQGHEAPSQLHAALLRLWAGSRSRSGDGPSPSRIRGVDGVGDHRLRRGFGDQLLQPGPRPEPVLHRRGVERSLGQLLEVGDDVFPGGLGEGGG